MSWTLLLTLIAVLGLTLAAIVARRRELAEMKGTVERRTKAELQGAAEAQLVHPVIDLSRCLGCGTCVDACPESGVLEMVHGQAAVVLGARCMGHSACERECPTGAITVTVANLETRNDVPAIAESLEAVGSPGLFLAGEVTAHTLIKKAVDHGTMVAAQAADRVAKIAARTVDPVTALGLVTEDVEAPSTVRSVAAVGSATSRYATGAVGAVQGSANGDAVGEAQGSANGDAMGPAPGDADDDAVLDLCIVGAGPAGLACSLEAKRRGLQFVTLDQADGLGGTVAAYPRRKLVLTQPLDMPLYGRLPQKSYSKEELIGLWRRIAREQELPIRCGVTYHGLSRGDDGLFLVRTGSGTIRARTVCLAIGRRGSPRKLGIPGEELPKVAYSLLDARSYTRRKIVVVGGGDSAIEAAVGLAEQPGNEVTLSYRKESFFRLRPRNEKRLAEARRTGRLKVLTKSHLRLVRKDSLELEIERGGKLERVRLLNDDVFIMAGGVAPVELLESAGVSLDPASRPTPRPTGEQGTGLRRALIIAFVLSLLAAMWALWHADYYMLPATLRPAHSKHMLLRPGLGIGLALGIAATVLVCMNLLYLVRRNPRFNFRLGSLRLWMTSHVATGILAFLCATLHGAMAPRHTVGGHAYLALAGLLVTGAIGRYLYAYVPRAANGRELELEEVRSRLATQLDAWDSDGKRFARVARREVAALLEARQWHGSFFARALALLGGQRDLRRVLTRLAVQGRRDGVPDKQIRATVQLCRRAHRTALMVAHYEDLRALLNSWRYFHRWVAALMVLLLIIHVLFALSYGSYSMGGGTP